MGSIFRKVEIFGNRKIDVVELFADGACSGTPAPEATEPILRYGDLPRTRSQDAIRKQQQPHGVDCSHRGLRLLKRPCRIRVMTDSTYVVKRMTEWIKSMVARKWRNSKKTVVNRISGKTLLELSRPPPVGGEQWVKGHHGHEGTRGAIDSPSRHPEMP